MVFLELCPCKSNYDKDKNVAFYFEAPTYKVWVLHGFATAYILEIDVNIL